MTAPRVHWVRAGAALCALSLWFGCAVPIDVDSRLAELRVAPRRVVVLPFESVGESVSEMATELVSARVFSELDASQRFELVSPVDVLIVQRREPDSGRAELVSAFAADAFLRGRVSRYEGRVLAGGAAVGPAWVDFELVLEDRDGRRLWRGRYAERQRGTFEDLAALSRAYRRGFRWVDPARLAGYGAAELVATLVRQSSELARP